MSIKSKNKLCVEVICFEDCAGQFMRTPWHGVDIYDWWELSGDVNAWILITNALELAELEAHWYDAKGGY
jgi:hypothetical protein